jgi:hypothetical protein
VTLFKIMVAKPEFSSRADLRLTVGVMPVHPTRPLH